MCALIGHLLTKTSDANLIPFSGANPGRAMGFGLICVDRELDRGGSFLIYLVVILFSPTS
ncbi:hypothetical protein MOQ72_01475 [Saccharopolyspora sp. K220]|uniref:hypothetical protein n=1 Tax=Saccharopolyspora soli TaxID=2926618 RepID=UPI001F57EAD7|nr:hypothetical protein [Saccharopolyspora soli]MCI2416081.1 hypothetical protein [Saccharopolyspora soli]